MQTAEYVKIHKWLAKNYGKADKCSHCSGENAKRFEWALLKGKNYDYNIENFFPLCPSCHRKYDMTDEIRKSHSKRMKKNPPTHRLKLFTGMFGSNHPKSKAILKLDADTLECIKEYGSLSDAMSDGYKTSALSMCLRGKNKTAYGFKWKFKHIKNNTLPDLK